MTDTSHVRNWTAAPRSWLSCFGSLLLGCSLLLSVSLGVGAGLAFCTTFTIENGSDQTISVTPVGAVGPLGSRQPLPTCRNFVYSFPESIRGGYQLRPGESVAITYDWDDINLSEIVVDQAGVTWGQLVVDPQPTLGRYHAPRQKHFRIDRAGLVPAPENVLEAAQRAQVPTALPWILGVIIVVPWLAVAVLAKADRGLTKHSVERLPGRG